ncbi:MarR family winged helix-turn-helix transcriptional regulator [Achromobacter sp. NFACC18-2]|uniref:MarR family winged helix-turn-helix transcriptional regulator n=1 Tax=Achromobacter sp. NFACC18-2 TaxID=1564112 RepID=UPI0008C6CD7F|nr:MarR family transcriptional regulator [Achromobacter sp. NFACC18-2]SEJ66627.1 DNA-binding transcriptional regulator, MarR family [Achromobacter sp. NFACC18-2]
MRNDSPSVLDELCTGELGFLVTSVRNGIHEALDRELAPLQITVQQYVVLNCIVKGWGRTLSDFCRVLAYDSGAMTRLLDRIAAKGFIRRVENEADRRSYLIELTEMGQAAFPQARQATEVAFRRLLAGFSEAEGEMLHKLLSRLLMNARSDQG